MEYKTTRKFNKEVLREILKIKEQKGLTPINIIESAKEEDSPLHKFFEWDNNIAGIRWRIDQARELINEVKVIINKKEYYAFESVVVNIDKGKEIREYINTKEVVSNKKYRSQVIDKALQQLMYFKNKYDQYNEFEPVFRGIKEVEKKINGKKK